jgi:hypothetical protein
MQVKRSRLTWLVLQGTGIDIDAILATLKAHKVVQPLARALAAAAHAIIAHHRQQHWLLHVQLTQRLGLATSFETFKVGHEVLAKMTEIAVGAVAGHGDVLTDLQTQWVIGLAAAAVPVVAHFVHAQKFGLGILGQTGIDRVSVLLRCARWASAASFR